MNIAIDKITGAKILADNAKSFKTYRCPECAAPVFLVDARYQVRHFRHRVNTAKEGCPLFHAGVDSSGVFKRKAFRQRQPRLVIQTTHRQGQFKWQPYVVVPKLDEFTSFTLSESPNVGRILMASVDPKGREFPVYPCEAEYVLGLYNHGKLADTVNIDGFARLGLFRLSAGFGSRVEMTEELSAGTAYVLVSKEPLRALPPEVHTRGLTGQSEWNAYVIYIPLIISTPVRDWVAANLRRKIRDVEPLAAVIWPPMAEHGLDGNWFIPPNPADPPLVAVQSRGSVTLVREDGREPSKAPLLEAHNILRVDGLVHGYYELRFDNSRLEPLCLVVTPTPKKPRCEAITFEIFQNDSCRVEPLWSEALVGSFEAIRAGDAKLRGVSIPKFFHVDLKVFFQGKEIVKTIEGGTVGNELLFRELDRCIRTDEARIEINAGGFGHLFFPTPRTLELVPNRKAQESSRRHWLRLAGFDHDISSDDVSEEICDLRAHIRQAKMSF